MAATVAVIAAWQWYAGSSARAVAALAIVAAIVATVADWYDQRGR